MNREQHKKLFDQYLSHGGDMKKVHLYKSFSLANYVKLKYFFKQLDIPVPDDPKPEKEIEIKAVSPEKERKSIFSDLISNYPKELHPAFKKRYDHWLEVCSLKVELNQVHHTDEETAYDIQEKMFDHLEKMDKCQNALDHYREHKRIMSTKTLMDFSKLSPMELLQKRNSTRSNISKRKATMTRMEESLPKNTDPDYRKKLHQLNRKKEQIQELHIQLEQLDELITG